MAEKPKLKSKPIKRMTKAEQSERFKETARELGAGETGKIFERVLRKLVPPQRRS
jgi:hypothetical protein